MKVIILCGGKGQRISGTDDSMPKPMLLVNGVPLIQHIINIYLNFGLNEFILPLGYKGEVIKQYFVDYEWRNSDITKHVGQNAIEYYSCRDNFSVTLTDTGLDTMTGARIKRVEKYIDGDTFMVTYGDGLSDIHISNLLAFHWAHGKIGTVTGINKKSQYGTLVIENDLAVGFDEKQSNTGTINGGFFVFEREFLNYLSTDPSCVLEDTPLQRLIEDKQLAVFPHNGLWLSVDTHKDLAIANEIWGKPIDKFNRL